MHSSAAATLAGPHTMDGERYVMYKCVRARTHARAPECVRVCVCVCVCVFVCARGAATSFALALVRQGWKTWSLMDPSGQQSEQGSPFPQRSGFHRGRSGFAGQRSTLKKGTCWLVFGNSFSMG